MKVTASLLLVTSIVGLVLIVTGHAKKKMRWTIRPDAPLTLLLMLLFAFCLTGAFFSVMLLTENPLSEPLFWLTGAQMLLLALLGHVYRPRGGARSYIGAHRPRAARRDHQMPPPPGGDEGGGSYPEEEDSPP